MKFRQSPCEFENRFCSQSSYRYVGNNSRAYRRVGSFFKTAVGTVNIPVSRFRVGRAFFDRRGFHFEIERFIKRAKREKKKKKKKKERRGRSENDDEIKERIELNSSMLRNRVVRILLTYRAGESECVWLRYLRTEGKKNVVVLLRVMFYLKRRHRGDS